MYSMIWVNKNDPEKDQNTEKTENTLSSNESSNRLDFVKIKSFTETWLKQIHTRPH